MTSLISRPNKASLNCGWDVLKNLPRLLVIAHFFITLPLEIPGDEDLKVEAVEQQMATQERMCVPLVYEHWVGRQGRDD